MKLYAKTIPQILPDWATIVTFFEFKMQNSKFKMKNYLKTLVAGYKPTSKEDALRDAMRHNKCGVLVPSPRLERESSILNFEFLILNWSEATDEHPNFQSLLEELATEIEPGTISVKVADLCLRLGIEMSSPNLYQLLEQAQTLVHEIVEHPKYKELLNRGYSPDLNIADAQTALVYLQWELDQNQEPDSH